MSIKISYLTSMSIRNCTVTEIDPWELKIIDSDPRRVKTIPPPRMTTSLLWQCIRTEWREWTEWTEWTCVFPHFHCMITVSIYFFYFMIIHGYFNLRNFRLLYRFPSSLLFISLTSRFLLCQYHSMCNGKFTDSVV